MAAKFNLGDAILTMSADATKLAIGLNNGLNSIRNFMGNVARMATIAGGAMTMVSGGLIRAGMVVQESESLFEVSLAGMADAARKWSEATSDALGLNSFEVRKNLGIWMTMFKSMGIGTDQSYAMAKSLVQLGADLESFFNLGPDQGFEKLRAAIVGETEPMRALGVVISASAVEANALATGINDGTHEMTEQEKVLSRFDLLMKQTTNAQGDLARTAGSAANQTRRMKNETAEASAEVGLKLLPAYQNLLNALAPLVGKTADFATANPALVESLAKIGGVLLIGGPLLRGLSSFLGFMGTLASGVKSLTLLLGGAGMLTTAAVGSSLFVAITGIVALIETFNNSTGFDNFITRWIKQFGLLQKVIDTYYDTLVKIGNYMLGIKGQSGKIGPGSYSLSELQDKGLIARAIGGPVRRGGAYMVGERGPEPFFPSVNGSVLSTGDMKAAIREGMSGGMKGITIHVGNIITQDPADFFRQLKRYTSLHSA